MFKKSLSDALLKLMGEKNITQEQLAEACDLTPQFIGNVIRKKSSLKMESLEKMCAALEVTPNDLLLSERAKAQLKEGEPKRVTKIFCIEPSDISFPICPGCNTTLDREYQSYCDRCGQFLSWKGYRKAEIIYFENK